MFFRPTIQNVCTLICILVKMVVVANIHVFRSALLLVRPLFPQVCDINSVLCNTHFVLTTIPKLPTNEPVIMTLVSLTQPTETFYQ